MNQRVYAPEQFDIDDFRDNKVDFHLDYGDFDRSCRMTFEKPSEWSISSQIDPTSTNSSRINKTIARTNKTSRKGLKTLPVRRISEKKTGAKVRRKNHALKEIRTYQRTGELLIPRRPFRRLCVEIARRENPEIRFQAVALEALQEATEAFVVGMIEDSQLCTIHAKRVTLMQKDMELAQKIRK